MSQELSDKEFKNAFGKLKITPETESPIKENSGNLVNGIKTMILDSIIKLREKRNSHIKILFLISYPKWWLQILIKYSSRFHVATNNPRSSCEQKDSKRF